MRRDYEEALAKALISTDSNVSTRDVIAAVSKDVGFSAQQAINTLGKWRKAGYYDAPDGTDLDMGGLTEAGLKYFTEEHKAATADEGDEGEGAAAADAGAAAAATDTATATGGAATNMTAPTPRPAKDLRGVEILLAKAILEQYGNAMASKDVGIFLKATGIDNDDLSEVVETWIDRGMLESDLATQTGSFTEKGKAYCAEQLGVTGQPLVPTPRTKNGVPEHCPRCGNPSLGQYGRALRCPPCGWTGAVGSIQ